MIKIITHPENFAEDFVLNKNKGIAAALNEGIN